MILRRYKDHFLLLEDGDLVGTTSRNNKVPSIYRHQCSNAFIGLFHELEVEVEVDMTLDDRNYINQIRRKDAQ